MSAVSFFGVLCAKVFLDRLVGQARRSSDRIVVDTLPADVTRALFQALMAKADATLEIPLNADGQTNRVRLAALTLEPGLPDLIPYLASSREDAAQNAGDPDFASGLRDFYAVGATRPRLLVVLTAEPNETQKSARDGASDKALLSLPDLLSALLDRHNVPTVDPLRAVAEVFGQQQAPDAAWPTILERLDGYLEHVVGKSRSEQGERLPELGVFLADPNYAAAGGDLGPRVNVLPAKAVSRREQGTTRLHDNAMVRQYLEDILSDPLTDNDHALREFLPDDLGLASEVARGGTKELDKIGLDRVASAADPKVNRRQLNKFSVAAISVRGAAHFRQEQSADGKLLVITASGSVTITLPLEQPFERKREYARLVRWREARNDRETVKLEVATGAPSVEVELQVVDGGFVVVNVLLARGVRTIQLPIDSITIAIYGSSAKEVLLEEDRRLSLEDQAWTYEGEPRFQQYRPGQDATDAPVTGTPPTGAEAAVVSVAGSSLRPRLVLFDEPISEDPDDATYDVERILEVAGFTSKVGDRTWAALTGRYPGSIESVSQLEEAGQWRVTLTGGDRRAIFQAQRSGGFLCERAVGALLVRPGAWRVDSDEGVLHFPEAADIPELARFAQARAAVRVALLGRAQSKGLRSRRPGEDPTVPLWLLPLTDLEDTAQKYLDAWLAAVRAADRSERFSEIHEILLQTDTLRVRDGGDPSRVVVLPTHPWLLLALVQFQSHMTRYFQGKRTALRREDIEQLVPKGPVEDWSLSDGRHFTLVDSAPFHLEFVPTAATAARGSLAYIARIIANKITRYVRMHPHLRTERRTLKLGFVNAGDGEHVLEGLQLWLQNVQKEHAGRGRNLPTEQIPQIELFLFASGEGGAFERFFREQAKPADETLSSRLRYRRAASNGPRSNADSVHICFVHGLVNQRTPVVGPLADGWDGAFGDGLLATYLRRTEHDGPRRLQSRRGLWVGAEDGGLRGALADLHALLRSRRHTDVARGKALYWESPLPDISVLAPTYEYSDWVVHLDRELSLDLFTSSDTAPTIIEYSDQEVADSPGYDTITVTQYATPYLEQLGEILTMAGLDVQGRTEAARRAANHILAEINVLSGSWALDFLMGSIADHRTSLRLKGNVGAALVYRWLRRIEQTPGSDLVASGLGEVLPVFVSLEDLLRATPAAGLKVRDGLVHRFTNEDEQDEKGRAWCDDLLVLYVPKSVAGEPTRIWGRIVEVKLGGTRALRQKAPAQVKGTRELLARVLSGDQSSVDAPFRNKQLSLLLKAQIERSIAVGAVKRETLGWLNVPALSQNLATGNYTVEYTISAEGKHLDGDVFLLDTTDAFADRTEARIEIEDGVRFITIGRPLVEILAFELEDAITLAGTPPANTLPRLGRYQSVVTFVGPSPVPAIPPPLPAVVHHVVVEAAPKAPPIAEAPPVVAQAVRSGSATSPVKVAPYADSAVLEVVERLEKALVGQRVGLAGSLSPREVDRGPRLLRVYVQLAPSEQIASVRKVSEDLARIVGTSAGDIHITNVPERRAVALDLPIKGLEYTVTFDELLAHASFADAQARMSLGFCAGIDVTGHAVWADLAAMPHMLVAGTTGSGKSVFLRNIILTLVLNRGRHELVLRMSSSKPMDFRAFAAIPHTGGRAVAASPEEALELARELIVEMERRLALVTTDPWADNILQFNENNPDRALPFLVAVFDEYAEMVASFEDKAERDEFETAIGRLAQKARAGGIHLVICMQRPDVNAIKGAIKANILHRFALKLPQATDSRVILDENGAEALLGSGDLLYKDGSGRLNRLQVPALEPATLRRLLEPLLKGPAPAAAPPPVSVGHGVPQARMAAQPVPPPVQGDAFVAGGFAFPEGTIFRGQAYGTTHLARVEGGVLRLDGHSFTSPSGAASHLRRGNGTLNGWAFWSCQLPGETTWQSIDVFRRGTPTAVVEKVAPPPTGGPFMAGGFPFPDGTVFRARAYGKVHYAHVKKGALWIDKHRFTSPSSAASHIRSVPVNGWRFWECQLPGRTTWQSIDHYRREDSKT